jgi:hypothetical protein
VVSGGFSCLNRENDTIVDAVELKNGAKADAEIAHARSDKRPGTDVR